MAADERAPSIDEITSVERSTLDREEARARLERWLAGRLGAGASVEIPALSSPSGSGMSSDTLLFDARVRTDAGEETLSLVARLAPQHRDVPVFPSYDLAAQFRLLGLVAAQGGVPVPRVRWLETDAAHLGAPFLAMDRVEGRVPSDVPPYVFAGFVLEASDAERATLERSTVEAMAALHAIDAERADAGFLAFPVKGDTPLERHVENQRDYYAWVVADGVRHPLLERTFAWLDAHWPAHESEPVISWGDSRIGNVIYRGFEPAALLDWEMAGLGPRELDLGWLCFMHSFFQDIAVAMGMTGLPDFLRLPNAAAAYERASGRTPRDLVWYYVYAALRHGIVMSRIQRRMIAFGQSQWTDDPDSVIPHRPALERLLDGSWSPLT